MTKTITVISALVIGLMMSSAAFSQSTVKDSNVTIDSKNTKVTTKVTGLLGKNSDANTGGVTLNNKALIKNSNVTVKSKNTNVSTSTRAKNASANTGGLIIK